MNRRCWEKQMTLNLYVTYRCAGISVPLVLLLLSRPTNVIFTWLHIDFQVFINILNLTCFISLFDGLTIIYLGNAIPIFFRKNCFFSVTA